MPTERGRRIAKKLEHFQLQELHLNILRFLGFLYLLYLIYPVPLTMLYKSCLYIKQFSILEN